MSSKYARIRNTEELKDEILALRVRSERQKEHLQETFHDLKESVRPVNLARQSFEALKNAGKNNGVMKSVLGLGGGMAAKQLLFGSSKGFFGKIWSAGVEKLLSGILSNRFGIATNQSKSGNPKWVDLLTGDDSKGKTRIILGNKEARFVPPVTLLPAGE